MLLLLTSLALSALALLLSYLLGKNNPGKSSSLTGGIILIILLLPLTLLLPKIGIPLPFDTTIAFTKHVSQNFSWYNIFLYIWLTGTAFLTIRLCIHYLSVQRWRRLSTRCSTPEWTSRLHHCCSMLEMDTIPSLGLSAEISSPVVTGLIYPQILLPKSSLDWEEDTINHVLLHELGHVKRRDLWISVASHLTCALHWYNPLVWILRKMQAAQCEFACDSFVLSSGANPKHYIHAICNVAETASDQEEMALALAMANKATLRQRVEILLREQQPHGKALTLVILLSTATLALAINVVETLPTQQLAPAEPGQLYSEEEIQTRLSADPFPAD